MAGDLGVFVIHGMGNQGPGFADGMVAELVDRIASRGANPDRVSFQSSYWANILRQKEEDLWDDLQLSETGAWRPLRQFVVNALGDATAYRRVGTGHEGVYNKVHKVVQTGLAALRGDLGGDKPLVIIAHSLGAHIMSNYIWDAQRNQSYDGSDVSGWSAFERMDTLVGFMTCGSNIPLFTLAYEEVEAIEFPPSELREDLKPLAKWLNFYDRDDVLAYPLKNLSDSYRALPLEDHQINVGGVLEFWNPASHTEYWTDNDFTRPVARYLTEILVGL